MFQWLIIDSSSEKDIILEGLASRSIWNCAIDVARTVCRLGQYALTKNKRKVSTVLKHDA